MNKTLRFLKVVSLLLGFVFMAATPAFAAVMPNAHDGFANDDAICVICHRTHTALNEQLLRSDGGMCLTCHQGGIGADTDVWNGAYAEFPNSDNYDWGATNGTLLGGGFAHVGGSTMGAATSNHKLSVALVPPGSTSGASVQLECTSCHTIHTNFLMPEQYRQLRSTLGDAIVPISVPWNGPWEGPAQTMPKNAAGYMAYTDTQFGTGVTFNTTTGTFSGASREVSRNYKSGIAAWCSACHSKYMDRKDLVAYNAGDSEGLAIRYRHAVNVKITSSFNIITPTTLYDFATDLPLEDKTGLGRSVEDTMTCLTCHRAHGTSAVMTAFSETDLKSAGDRGTLPSGTDSMLLRLNDREVCQTACHKVVSP